MSEAAQTDFTPIGVSALAAVSEGFVPLHRIESPEAAFQYFRMLVEVGMAETGSLERAARREQARLVDYAGRRGGEVLDRLNEHFDFDGFTEALLARQQARARHAVIAHRHGVDAADALAPVQDLAYEP